jgi:hypothetical protein
VTDRLRKIAADVLPGRAEFAPGIPTERSIKPVPRVKTTRPEVWGLTVQEHAAERAGAHADLRLVDKRGRAHSWAIPKGSLPKPGEKVKVLQQPTHTREYAEREGEFTIPKGVYGAGRVRAHGIQPVEVVRSQPGLLRFNLYGGAREGNQEYALVKTEKGSLLHNISATAERGVRGTGGHEIPSAKPKYREVKTERVRFDDPNEVHQAKVDGAHVTFHLRADKPVKVFSYRPTERATGVLEHTHKLPAYRKLKTPPSLAGTVLRGELYGAKTRSGKALPAELTGGLLNASVWKSRERQKELGAELRPVVFDVVRYKGRDVSEAPYERKLQILREVQHKQPRLRLPPTAETPEEKRRLFQRIESGKEPITSEGIIAWRKDQPGPTKAKFRPDVDALVVGTTGGKGKHEGRIGALKVRLPGKDAVTHVGTGLSDRLRAEIAEDPKAYIGRAVKVRTQQVFPSGKMRAPSFGGFHIEKGKQKLAQEETHPAAAAGMVGAGGLAALGPGTRGRLLGYQRVYHGTTEPAARQIGESGLLASKGSTGATTASGMGSSADPFFTETRGKVHVTPRKNVARLYANYMKRHGRGKGAVVAADLPMEIWEKLQRDPMSAPPLTGRTIAARGATDVPSKYIRGGKGFSRLELMKERLRGLPSYIAKHPGRFAVGLAGLGGGLYLAHRGAKALRPHLEGGEQKTAAGISLWGILTGDFGETEEGKAVARDLLAGVRMAEGKIGPVRPRPDVLAPGPWQTAVPPEAMRYVRRFERSLEPTEEAVRRAIGPARKLEEPLPLPAEVEEYGR